MGFRNRKNFNIGGSELLYQFEGRVIQVLSDGEPERDLVIVPYHCNVQFFSNMINIKRADNHPDFGGLGSEYHYSPENLKIKKQVKEGRFFFKKILDVWIDIIIDDTWSTEIRLKVKGEDVADDLINWINS